MVICKQPGRYIGWPTIARTATGELLAVFSGDRDAHVCPFGKTQLVRSQDDGRTWSEPETITDGPLDDRDAGIHVLGSGTLLVNWFTSLAFESERHLEWMRRGDPEAQEQIDSWQAHIAKLTDEDREKYLGRWTRRSTDGGQTWEEWVNSHVGSPHGPTQLSDGRLLYLGRGHIAGKTILGASESNDEGRSWELIWTREMKEEEQNNLCELHQAELPDGRIVGMIRYDTGPHHYLWQTDSEDGGHTWRAPHVTRIWGLPPHLLVLRDGRLLVTYGHRREPYGQRACLSGDGGRAWDLENEIILRDDAPNGDLGYPASIELEDGEILTVYYQVDRPGEKTCLMTTRWNLPPKRQPKSLAGPKVEMAEPTVLTMGPPEECRWGFYQFPHFARTEGGELAALCQVADDSHDDAGERHASPRFVTQDAGKTWEPLPADARLQQAKALRDGTEMTTMAGEKRPFRQLGISPVGRLRDHYGNEYDLFRHEDLPADMRGFKFLVREPRGEAEEILGALDVPGLLVGACRLTHTSAGRVELEGNIRPLELELGSTQFLELPDGALLYAFGGRSESDIRDGHLSPADSRIYLLASSDRGRNWEARSTIAHIPEQAPFGLYEQTLTRLPNGTLVCVMRSEEGGPPEDPRNLWLATSKDNGSTWCTPRVLNHFGVEPELLTLENGMTAVSYGRPGVEIRFSSDGDGEQWSEPHVARHGYGIGGMATTCGYTKLVATGPDRFLIIYSDFHHRDDDWVLRKAIKVREIRATP